ncbi:hypothetical protein CN193_31865 [Sinorhizobium meliloti]|uniref:FAD-dependent oxidoreductase n=1 Tax=Rhizobium meliloti TaxID=382 RepID=UPI000FD8BE99|nr:hypothetical protein CN193_31865 [Sinorhizobium meliloti]
MAIGIHPNDHLARHAGLECNDGIVTDENGATSDLNIYAIGDVSCQRSSYSPAGVRIESWQNANEQAHRAAKAILRLDTPPASVPRFWSDQYDLTIQIAGMPNPNAEPPSMESNIHSGDLETLPSGSIVRATFTASQLPYRTPPLQPQLSMRGRSKSPPPGDC